MIEFLHLEVKETLIWTYNKLDTSEVKFYYFGNNKFEFLLFENRN